jgi:hypothetical protein
VEIAAPPCSAAEHEVVGGGEPAAVREARELGGRRGSERHGSRLARLGRGDLAAAPRRGDGGRRALEAHAPPAELEQLAHAQAGERSNDEEGGVLVVGPPPLLMLGV